MNKTNIPQNSINTETIIGAAIAVGVLALIAFCCCGRSKNTDDYSSGYTPGSSISTTSSITPSAAITPPSTAKTAVVITQNANLRKSNNAGSGVIQTIPEGTNVEIVKQAGAWFLVKNSGQTGWMHGNTIRFVNPPSTYSDLNSSPDSSYQRTRPGYDPNAPLLPRGEGDIEPLYNEVQRLKEQQGLTDAEAVDKILRDAGEIP